MTTVPSSYDLAVLDCAITMLCASTQWQTLCQNLPRSRIVFYDAGDPARGQTPTNIDNQNLGLTPPLCLIDQTDFPTQAIAGGSVRSGSVILEFAIDRPSDLGHADTYRYALGVFGLIKDQIAAQQGRPNCFAEVSPRLVLGPITDPTGALAQNLTATISLDWRALQ